MNTWLKLLGVYFPCFFLQDGLGMLRNHRQPKIGNSQLPRKKWPKKTPFFFGCWKPCWNIRFLHESLWVRIIHFEKLFELFLRIRPTTFLRNEHEFWTNHPKLFRETKKLQQSFSSSVVAGFHEFCGVCFQEWHIMHIWVVVSNMFYFQPYLGTYSHFD